MVKNEYITTSKVLTGLTSLLLATLLIAGVMYPESFIMWFADTSTTFAVIRAIALSFLVALLVSKPPRSVIFRSGLGLMALVLAFASISSLYTYEMGIVDAVIFFEMSIIMAIEALELRQKAPAPKKKAASKKVAAKTTKKKRANLKPATQS